MRRKNWLKVRRIKEGVRRPGVAWCWWSVVVVCSNPGVLLLHADLSHAQPQSPSVAVTPPYRHHLSTLLSPGPQSQHDIASCQTLSGMVNISCETWRLQ